MERGSLMCPKLWFHPGLGGRWELDVAQYFHQNSLEMGCCRVVADLSVEWIDGQF
jgi:hypothetical protein